MNKKGFISTALIYTFFILFLVLMVFLLNNYSSTRYIVDRYRYDIEEELYELSNADINIYTYVWSNRDKEYKYVDNIPMSGLRENISYCKNKSTIEFNDGEVTIGAKGKEFCYLYFDPAGDITAPTITASDGKGEASWHKGGVSLSISGSTIQNGVGEIAYFYGTDASNINTEGTSTGIINTEGTITYYAKACNTYNLDICSDVEEYTLMIDNTAPTFNVANTSNGNSYTGGWTKNNVDSALTFEDSESGIDASSLKWGSNGTTWTSIPNTSTTGYNDSWTNERNGTGYYQICDLAGNCTTRSFMVKIDKTKPSVSFSLSGQTATYTCSNGGSGSPLSGTTSGNHALSGTSNYTYSVTCTDEAGNSKTDSHTYTYGVISGSNTCSYGCDTCGGEPYDCNCVDNYTCPNPGDYKRGDKCYSHAGTYTSGCPSWAAFCNTQNYGYVAYVFSSNATNHPSCSTCHTDTYSCRCNDCYYGSDTRVWGFKY